MQAADVARLMNRYARAHAGGAFASPTTAELERHGWHEWGVTGQRVVATVARSTRRSTRTDWTGRSFTLPPGAAIASFIARDARAPIPQDLASVDAAHVYATDYPASGFFFLNGFQPYATRITAASEIITTWTARGLAPARSEHPADVPTAARLSWAPGYYDWVPLALLRQIIQELHSLHAWADDYPYYSDGTWSAINLRGYWDDPLQGVKPAEMPRKWQREHPEAMHAPIRWTSITRRLPAMMTAAESLACDLGADELQRVRLMRMAGPGKLARHSDVTDRQAGTRDGQVARFHIPLVTHRSVVMQCWELDGQSAWYHLAPGTVWYLDQRKPHAVTNPAKVDRVHLVVDVIVNESVRKHLQALCPTSSSTPT